MRLARSFLNDIAPLRAAVHPGRQNKPILKLLMPRHHTNLARDALFILKTFGPSQGELSERQNTIGRVRHALRSLLGDCAVEDCSMHKYAADVHGAPLELMIVDNKNQEGFPPGADYTKLPDIYNPSRVSQALLDAGFEGGFVSYPKDILPMPEPNAGWMPPPSPRKMIIPWPEYVHTPFGGLLYPLQLQASDAVPFTLTLPGPTISALYRYIASTTETTANFTGQLISLLFIWTRSLELIEFTPECLALMVVQFMQSMYCFPKPPTVKAVDAEAAEKGPGGWVLHEFQRKHSSDDGWYSHPVWLETALVPDHKLYVANTVTLSVLLMKFFSFWSDAANFSKLNFVSVRENCYPPRQRFAEQFTGPLVETHRVHSPDDLTFEPPVWRLHRLIVQDPFVPTHNHAEGVSNETVRYFGYNCQLAARSIKRGYPLSAIFGAHFPPPVLKLGNMHHGRGTRSYHANEAVRSELKNIYQSLNPPEPVVKKRSDTILRVQNVIQRQYGREYTVELFGSARYGVSSPSSDLDLVILDPHRMSGFAPDVDPQELPSIYNINTLGILFRRTGFIKVRSIPSASVPIVKFHDPQTGLDCDINVNEQLGLINSNMISRYCDLSPLLRPMIAFIKRWAKPLGLNSPSVKGGPVTFSSYAFVLMTIGRLQMRQLLLNLQEGVGEPDNAKREIFWQRKKDTRLECDIRYIWADGWTPQANTELDEALFDWFNYWGHEYVYGTDIVSIREGGLVPRCAKPIKESTDEQEMRCNPQNWNSRAAPPNADLAEGSASGTVTSAPVRSEDDEDEDDVLQESLDPTSPDLTDNLEEEPEPLDDEIPIKLAKHSLCVVDPFIRTKNVTANIQKNSLDRFRKECQRAVLFLTWGGSLDDLLGDSSSRGKSLRPRPPRNGRSPETEERGTRRTINQQIRPDGPRKPGPDGGNTPDNLVTKRTASPPRGFRPVGGEDNELRWSYLKRLRGVQR